MQALHDPAADLYDLHLVHTLKYRLPRDVADRLHERPLRTRADELFDLELGHRLASGGGGNPPLLREGLDRR